MYCTQHLQCEHLEVLGMKGGQLCPKLEVDAEPAVASPTSELLLINKHWIKDCPGSQKKNPLIPKTTAYFLINTLSIHS